MYLNPGCEAFKGIISTKKYVDKTLLIENLDRVIETSDKLICFTKPRRFGKSYAAKMLSAYYSKGADSKTIFSSLKIGKCKGEDLEKYLNKFNVIYIDITSFLSDKKIIDNNYDNLINQIVSVLQKELIEEYALEDDESFTSLLSKVKKISNQKFVFIIDEWDAIFRELPERNDIQAQYIDFLRSLFKNGNFTDDVVALAYMTGILPIKKYGTQSAISDFHEYTMTNCGELEDYIGFNEDEVKAISDKGAFTLDELKVWYDGYYSPKGTIIFNPNSIMESFKRSQLDTYWVNTETYEQLKKYIEMDFDGIRQDIANMLGDEKISANVSLFQNDLSSISSKDDVYTLLIHLGYLSYDYNEKKVFIPNLEIKHEFKNALSTSERNGLMEIVKNSDKLINATLLQDADTVSELIENVHTIYTDPLHYNNEQALRAVIKMAYISAIDDYVRIEELPSGNGYVDIAFLPKVENSKPAMLIELKWNKDVDTAITQIRNNKYPAIFNNYRSKIILVAVNYDSKSKKHECQIEMMDLK